MAGQFHSLIDIFKTGKEQYPEKTAIIMGEDTRTYGQICDNAKRIAGFVLEKEIKPQDKVAVISQNPVSYTHLPCFLTRASHATKRLLLQNAL